MKVLVVVSVAIEVTISYRDLVEQTYGLLLHMIVILLLLKLFIDFLLRSWTELMPVFTTGHLFHQSVGEHIWLVNESMRFDLFMFFRWNSLFLGRTDLVNAKVLATVDSQASV